MAKILIPIDNGASRSTSSAFGLACKKFNKEHDELFLVNVFSSWDYLNEEKNAGKMCLSQYERLCESEGIRVKFARQMESDDPNADLVEFAEEYGINFIYIGANAFTATANEDNLVFSFFSRVKRYFTGTTAEYLSQNCKCRVIVVPEPEEQL